MRTSVAIADSVPHSAMLDIARTRSVLVNLVRRRPRRSLLAALALSLSTAAYLGLEATLTR